MTRHDQTDFLAGVIEGFYGPPWSPAERRQLLDWMSAWKLNTYLYAPKDDLKHRARWREPYSAEELGHLEALIQACREKGVRFIYALSPGLDIRYSDPAEIERIKQRFESLLARGCEHFALLFDDIPDRMTAVDQNQFGSFALAHSAVANEIFHWTRDQSPNGRFLFCPTPYCGRMAARKLGGENYLEIIGRELSPEIDVFWTGPEIISREITTAHVRELQHILRRKPLIWDNLHANDYDGRRFYCGPYAGRPPGICGKVSGLLVNPNCEFALNFVPFRTFARFVHGDATWDARAEYLAAIREWLPQFETSGLPVSFDDLVLLADCYYLPFEEGTEAESLFRTTQELIAVNPRSWREGANAFREKASRLRDLCARLTELMNRPLFYALSRRVWELREELDLLERYVAANAGTNPQEAKCTSDFHLPGTYRGGLVPRLQRLLDQHPDGTFTPSKSLP